MFELSRNYEIDQGPAIKAMYSNEVADTHKVSMNRVKQLLC